VYGDNAGQVTKRCSICLNAILALLLLRPLTRGVQEVVPRVVLPPARVVLRVRRTVVPIELLGERPIVRVRINGKGPLQFRARAGYHWNREGLATGARARVSGHGPGLSRDLGRLHPPERPSLSSTKLSWEGRRFRSCGISGPVQNVDREPRISGSPGDSSEVHASWEFTRLQLVCSCSPPAFWLLALRWVAVVSSVLPEIAPSR